MTGSGCSLAGRRNSSSSTRFGEFERDTQIVIDLPARRSSSDSTQSQW